MMMMMMMMMTIMMEVRKSLIPFPCLSNVRGGRGGEGGGKEGGSCFHFDQYIMLYISF